MIMVLAVFLHFCDWRWKVYTQMGSKYEDFKVQEKVMERGWEAGQGGEMNRGKSTKSGPGY